MIKLGDAEVNSRAYCSSFNFKGGDQQKKVGLLSGGERNRVHMAKLLRSGGNVILLDEPTAGMNHGEIANAVALIRKISAGKTLVVVEHDMGVVFDIADRISVLVYGEIIATGTPEEIRNNADVKEAYLGTEAV